ncbi:UNVERIFIED_CONTAM: hypothetical protein Sradi_2412300 [Sesamum radiatum]|uniref:Uncharacterized protein n=1 Tax=Sesamum radiatum TaxID=300843 RepID=A0AAW2SH66_SESRA
MGSVRFVGEDESRLVLLLRRKQVAEKGKHLLVIAYALTLNHAPVPRRLRSAIKKRSRESITPPLPISRKQLHMSNGVEILRVDGTKKSRLNMKQGQITKDEEEVAETLYSLADMFSDIAKTNKPVLDGEPSENKSSTIVEAGSTMTAAKDAEIPMQQEDSREINTRDTLESACHSSILVNSTEEVAKYQSLDDAQQPELLFSEQSATPVASGIPSHSSLGPRPTMSTCDMIRSCEQTISRKQVATSGIQYGNNHYPKEDKYKGLLLEPSLSSTGVVSSNTHGSGPLSSPDIFPAWFENTNCATQPIVKENSITADKGSNFLSLNAGGSDSSGGINRAGCSSEALNQLNVSYQRPQNHSAMLFSLPQNGYSSTFRDQTSTAAAAKVQLPPYVSNTFGGTVTAPLGQQLESQQQKWTSQLQAQYSPSRVGRPHLFPEWQNGGRSSPSLLNYAQALFPHLHSVMGSKYQHRSPPQQQNSPVNSALTLSNVERHHHRLNSAYERNGTTLCSENASHMQLLCNQQL